MKKKLNLAGIRVSSSTTTNIEEALKGGTGSHSGSICFCTQESQCNLCDGAEDASICCAPKK